MELNKLTLAVLAATSMTLVGCGGSSSSNDDNGTGDDIVTPEPLAVYTDMTWSAGADELVGLTYPQNATNGDMVALKRSTGSDDSISHTLMVAPAATKEFTAVEGVALEKDYYRDVLALPVSGTVEGEEIDTVLIATCGYDVASLIEGGEGLGGGEGGEGSVGMAAVAEEKVAIEPVSSAEPATLEVYLPGTDVTAAVDITDEGEDVSLIDCHSLGGLTYADLADKDQSVYDVGFFITGANDQGDVSVFEVQLSYDYDLNEVTETEFYELDDNKFVVSAIDVGQESDYYTTMTIEGSTYLLEALGEEGIVLGNDGNPFTSESEEGAIIFDLVYSGENLLAVSDDAGLAGADFTGEQFVMLTGGEYENCVDQLAVNGTTVWCHDSTDEGTLIEFTAPTVPQSEVVEAPDRVAARSYEVSKEEAEQIKAELEGAGAEVEVK
ncbi:MAG: hypothetical protein ACJAY0_000037 [Thalassolituus sp.]|jgi:hypothetical protein